MNQTSNEMERAATRRRLSRYRRGIDRAPGDQLGTALEHVTAPNPLYGSNGIAFGPDGRLYVAQLLGHQVSAVDLDSGAIEDVVPFGDPIAAPDDVAFDAAGVMYIADNMPGRVWARDPGGQPRLLADDIPAANGIACHGQRVFVNECRPGGRLFELYPDGRPRRLMLDELMTPNAMAIGPDGLLYFPLVIPGEIWRVGLDGGAPERVADGLALPPAVKFDQHGLLTVLSGLTGEVLKIDTRSGIRKHVAIVRAGLDNLAFDRHGRLFTTNFVDGGITEVLPSGRSRSVVTPGFNGPFGITEGADASLYVADGASLASVAPDGAVSRIGTLLQHGFPGVVRGVTRGPHGSLYVTTSAGDVVSYDPDAKTSATIATGLQEPIGIAVAPDQTLAVAEAGTGRILRIDPDSTATAIASRLERPIGVAFDDRGACYFTDAGSEVSAGRAACIESDGSTRTIATMDCPHGLAIAGDQLIAVDLGRKRLSAWPLAGGRERILASDLEVGAPPGVTPAQLCGVELMPGPLSSFSDIAMGADGTVYLSADGEGAVLALRPNRNG